MVIDARLSGAKIIPVVVIVTLSVQRTLSGMIESFSETTIGDLPSIGIFTTDRPPGIDGPPTSEMPRINAAAPASRTRLGSGRGRVWKIVAIVAGAVVVAIAAVAIAGTAWVRSQWYVGQSGGFVTIYRGVSGSVLGIPMQSTLQVSDLSVGTLPVFDAGLVADGIVADSEADAQRIVNDLRLRAAACAVVPVPAGCPVAPVTP